MQDMGECSAPNNQQEEGLASGTVRARMEGRLYTAPPAPPQPPPVPANFCRYLQDNTGLIGMGTSSRHVLEFGSGLGLLGDQRLTSSGSWVRMEDSRSASSACVGRQPAVSKRPRVKFNPISIIALCGSATASQAAQAPTTAAADGNYLHRCLVRVPKTVEQALPYFHGIWF